ncbi:MAG: SDR family oxidoreductase [Burkholderiales bacterium]|nr:SDR family oxidoreductase [Burkholderiales bacterium]
MKSSSQSSAPNASSSASTPDWVPGRREAIAGIGTLLAATLASSATANSGIGHAAASGATTEGMQKELAGKVAIVSGASRNLGRGSKAPVEDFTRALAREIGARGVTVNTIAPGAVNTPFFHNQETPESVAYVTKAHVLGRLAEVSDIVPMVEFLASPRAQWVSAQTIFVNGAYAAR